MSQHAIRREYIDIRVSGNQLTISRSAVAHRELRDRFIATCNGKHPWLTKPFVRTVRIIEHLDAATSGIIAKEYVIRMPGSGQYRL